MLKNPIALVLFSLFILCLLSVKFDFNFDFNFDTANIEKIFRIKQIFSTEKLHIFLIVFVMTDNQTFRDRLLTLIKALWLSVRSFEQKIDRTSQS